MAINKKQDWVNVGRLGSAHKLQGAIKLHVNESLIIKKMKSILCGKQQNTALPFLVTAIKPFSTNDLILVLDGINTREEAQQLSGSTIWIESKNVELSEQIVSEKMVSYEIVDVKTGKIGIISDIYFLPSQTLAVFLYNEKEILIPCNQETIVKINHTKKQFLVNMPEGLMEVYL